MKNSSRCKVQILVSEQRHKRQRDRPPRFKKQLFKKKFHSLSDLSARVSEAEPPSPSSGSTAPAKPSVKLWITGSRRGAQLSSAKVPTKKRGWLPWAAAVLTIALLLSGSWLAARLIVNPTNWLRGLLPSWNQGLGLQTLAAIRAAATQQGQTVGQPIALTSKAVLLPVLAPQPRCRDCLQLVELRVYRPQQGQFELIDRFSVSGVEELIAIAPLTNLSVTSAGSSRKLPLSSVTRLEGKSPDAGVWLNLSSDWQRGSTQTLYGQLLRYDPLYDRLQPMLTWTSPALEPPRWQQMTGSSTPELLINQTIGLEPQFQLYQVQLPNAPGKPVRLEAIGLAEFALDDPTYEAGLLLARNGLWSDALDYLRQVKQTGNWTVLAQAQLDLISLHAQQTQRQADRSWASPTQQITALVIDGRWTQALDRLKAAHTDGYDIRALLSANADLFWQRIAAALRVSRQPDVQRWGALVKAIQRDRPTAIAWLKQTQSSLSTAQVQALWALLDSPLDSPDSSPASPAAAPSAPLRLLGSATRTDRPDPAAWFSPRSIPMSTGSVWYSIDLLGVDQARQWQQPALIESANPQQAWNQLGLSSDAPLQLISWTDGTPQTIAATLQAIQIRSGQVRLLASAPASPAELPPRLLAITPNTLPWLTPRNRLSLAALAQQQPTATLTQTLERALQQAGISVSTAAQPVEQWSIEQMELTGNSQPESVLVLSANQPSVAPRTLIFSSEGDLLYGDLQSPEQAIVAFVDLNSSVDNIPPAIVLRTDRGYQLRRWQGQEFK